MEWRSWGGATAGLAAGLTVCLGLALLVLGPAATQAGAIEAEAPGSAPQAQAPAKSPAKSPGRRDPFAPLVARPRAGAAGAMAIPDRLPPGKAGLVIRTLRVDGVVRTPSGMLAVVVNHLNRVHFLRDGDQLYDGRVERINLEGVTFREVSRDEQGRTTDRVVVKRIYPTPGE